MNETENANRIREAWFLFPRDHIGLIRYFVWLVLWIFSIYAVTWNNIKSLANAYCIFTLSMIMEFSPSFSKYPQEAIGNNRSLLIRKKTLSIVFLIILGFMFFLSLVVVFFENLPKPLTIARLHWIYIIFFFTGFVYLFVNCIKGMCYVPDISNDAIEKKEKMYGAAEKGELGDVFHNE